LLPVSPCRSCGVKKDFNIIQCPTVDSDGIVFEGVFEFCYVRISFAGAAPISDKDLDNV
jgi:hypothetical protein